MKHSHFVPALALGLLAGANSAHADDWVAVAPNGTVTRTTITQGANAPQSAAGFIAQQSIGAFPNSQTTVTTQTYNQPYGYYPPPAYYGQQTYTYPGAAYSGPIAPPPNSWVRPAWITSIPLGGTVTTQTYGSPYYPPQVYPPNYGYNYPYPVYQNPYPTYGYGYGGYGYGTSTTQTNGYGVRLGNGGVSVAIGGTTTTTINR